MAASLIINARDRLSWQQRLFSDASTFVMWGAWVKLWVPLVKALAWVAKVSVVSHVTLAKLLPSGTFGGVNRYALALVATSGALVVWSRLPSFKVCEPEERSAADYARHFEVSEPELLAGRGSSVCVIHHDDAGRIVRIEQRAA